MKISTFLLSALLLLVLQSMSFAQTDKSFNYQAVVRKASGDLVQKTDVSVKFYILDDTGIVLYSEKQDVTTDAYGVLNLSVGAGSKLTGTFETITWDGDLNLKVEVDYDKNGSADLTGTTLIAKVPSAYYSAKAGLATKADGLTYDLAKVATSGDYSDLKNAPAEQTLTFDKTTNVLSISKGNTVDLSKLTEGLQNLSLSGNLLSIGGGNTVDLSYVGYDSDSQTLSLSGNTLNISGGNSITLPAGMGSGDMVTTTYDTNNNSKVDVAENSEKIAGVAVAATAPASGQVLTYNGSTWAPVAAASGLPSLTTAGSILTVDAAGTAAEWKAPVTMSGDISVNGTGVVTVDKIKNTSISATAPTNGQVLSYNGTAWAPAAATTVLDVLNSTSATSALSANQGKVLNDAITANTTALANKVDNTITVNGQPLTANVTITAADLSLDQVDNTADADKPVSIATQTALDLKADNAITVNGQPLTANVTITAADLSLGNVDNTSDIFKPLSFDAIAALQTKITAPAIRANGDLLKFDGTNWVAGAPGGVSNADATTKGVIMLAGDLAGTGSSYAAPVITDKAVTYAKMQDVAATSLIGNSTGSAATAQEITVGDGLTLNGGTLNTAVPAVHILTAAECSGQVYTLLPTDKVLIADSNLLNNGIKLPEASTCPGRELRIYNPTAAIAIPLFKMDGATAAVTGSTVNVGTQSGVIIISSGVEWYCLTGF